MFSRKEPTEKIKSHSQGQEQGLNRIFQRVGKHSTTEQLLVVCRQNTEGMMDGLRKLVESGGRGWEEKFEMCRDSGCFYI